VKRTTLALLASCLALLANAGAASAAIDCNSPYRDPGKSLSQFMREYREACSPHIALAAPNVADSKVRMSSASFSNVPTWSDADILGQFNAIRDRRYMFGTSAPSVQRRISWMYPDDGCYTRAEQIVGQAGDAGKARPYKLFAFGSLRVYTPNTASGLITWWYHVVPIVKNGAGEVIVLDPSIETCRPLRWKDWLALMTDNLSNFDLGGEWGVTVADPNAYVPGSLVTGEPSHRTESLNSQQGGFLNLEWNRQVSLGRDPNVVLAASPPWGNKACVTSFTQGNRVNVPGNSSATSLAKCPYGTLAVGGGLAPDTSSVLVTRSARNGNGWEVVARNRSSSTSALWSEVTCLQGAGSSASITTVTGSKVTIARNAFNSTTATCSSGQLVGGGFLTTVGGSPSSIMKIYLNGRTASTGQSWRISGFNTSSGSRDLTSYAYCLRNVSTSVSQADGVLTSFEEGVSYAWCPGDHITLGGGFTMPRTASYSAASMWNNQDGAFGVWFDPAPAGGDPNARAYAECMTKP
jgi:hypothetical protein